MKNTFGYSVAVTLFGESHGEEIGAVIDGMPSGIPVDREYIEHELSLRRPFGKISTPRVEKDNFRIVSGVYNGMTTGTPITVIIPNENTRSKDYQAFYDTPRPGHADYTAHVKYHGFEDYRGGGHFSGRLTAPIVAVGAIARSALMRKGIFIGTHIKRLHGISDRDFSSYKDDIESLSSLAFPVLDGEAAEKMMGEIEKAKNLGDSVGGILETVVTGFPAGVGEPFFDSIESVLSHAVYSIPAVKGVEFGSGFGFSELYGSQANDPFRVENGSVTTATNNNGGINGGISNGAPILFRTAIKPTPSISATQDTVSLSQMKDTTVTVAGRHDPCIVHRARAVVDSITALALCDLLSCRFGTDYLAD